MKKSTLHWNREEFRINGAEKNAKNRLSDVP
jgi:hypothetical protein